MAKVGDRFKTGDTCETSGIYAFDGYTDGMRTTTPTPGEQRITVSKGERFPPVSSARKAAYWKLETIG
ncbi:YjzC family protein [Pyxidicoccus fallax]|uniref:YjzC family protein n=1 Tax=Pyxidicoccus fallax TaxID=394095 RepID=A0A848L5P3_9BACT|nr:YjzC family protein [Pyxidicoccus fallax]NMO14029.1 YjzC family protein [Pyxidicoccus fallax]NPC76639.1 YjzC family protein [Pyxidicoccus fallax]